jgi:hypothetical protein
VVDTATQAFQQTVGGHSEVDVTVHTIWCRDVNSDTGTRYPPGTRPDRAGYKDDFLPTGGTRIRPEPRRIRGGYFFPPMGNPMGMILCCEQVKMCSFCDINYDLL